MEILSLFLDKVGVVELDFRVAATVSFADMRRNLHHADC